MRRDHLSRRQLRDRQIALIRELCQLSRDSWRHAKPADYVPREQELNRIAQKLRRTSR